MRSSENEIRWSWVKAAKRFIFRTLQLISKWQTRRLCSPTASYPVPRVPKAHLLSPNIMELVDNHQSPSSLLAFFFPFFPWIRKFFTNCWLNRKLVYICLKKSCKISIFHFLFNYLLTRLCEPQEVLNTHFPTSAVEVPFSVLDAIQFPDVTGWETWQINQPSET